LRWIGKPGSTINVPHSILRSFKTFNQRASPSNSRFLGEGRLILSSFAPPTTNNNRVSLGSFIHSCDRSMNFIERGICELSGRGGAVTDRGFGICLAFRGFPPPTDSQKSSPTKRGSSCEKVTADDVLRNFRFAGSEIYLLCLTRR
jgi:hypothetical protein